MNNEPTPHPSGVETDGASVPRTPEITRRDFLGAVTVASVTLASGAALGAGPSDGETASPGRVRLQSFDCVGVKLRPSRWQKQYGDARDLYFSLSADDFAPKLRRQLW